jgi:CRP-like cAMP-binding protein
MLESTKCPLLELLPEADRAAVVSRMRIQKFDAGQVVYERGAVCRDVFFIFEGRIRSEAQDLHGNMAFFQSRGPGEIIGVYSAITDEPQPVTTAAVKKSLLGRLAGPEFMAVVLGNRDVSAFMLRLLAGRLVSETRRITHLIVLDALRRVGAEILERANVSGPVIEVPERVDLAARLGMTRQTLAKQLSTLRRRRLIRIDGNNIHILDAKQLAELVG